MKTTSLQNFGLLAVFFFGSLFSHPQDLLAQEQEKTKTVTKVVVVNVDSSSEDGSKSNVKVIVTGDDEEMVWIDDVMGELSEEEMEKLKELNIDIDINDDAIEGMEPGTSETKTVKVIKNADGSTDTIVEVHRVKVDKVTIDNGEDATKPNMRKKVVILIDPTDTVAEDGEIHTEINKVEIIIMEPGKEDGAILDKNTPKSAGKGTLELERLAFYPNPNDGRFHLKFVSGEKGTLQVNVYDLAGKRVFNEELKNFTGGSYERDIDITGESKGTYLLQVIQNGKVLGKKIVVQ